MSEESKNTAAADVAVDEAAAAATQAVDAPVADAPAKKKHTVRNVVIVVVALVVVLCGAGVWAYGSGVITPAGAAAKYGTFDYLLESDVTDYIETYKEQMGYGDAEDDDWAQFLAAYNLTPERLRLSTIEQLLSDKLVRQKCADEGITVSSDELDAVIANLRSTMGLAGDDDTWKQTLELYGQTEQGLRGTYELSLLKRKLCTKDVETPTPNDDQVKSYIESFAASAMAQDQADVATAEEAQAIAEDSSGKLLRHSYRFVLKAAGDEPTLDESNQVELIKQEFQESGLNLDNFVAVVAMYSNDDDCKESNGSMGWDADTDDYSDTYVRMLETVGETGVSSVFTDGDEVCFIWVDQSYAIPYDSASLKALKLDDMPQSLREYFSDCEAYELWEDASDSYLSQLVADMNVTVYEMPSDVPYNVDMSAYLVESDDSEASSTESGD